MKLVCIKEKSCHSNDKTIQIHFEQEIKNKLRIVVYYKVKLKEGNKKNHKKRKYSRKMNNMTQESHN